MAAGSLFSKLKERKVFQWSLAYITAAWLIVQILEVLSGPWHLPEAWVRVVHIALVAGLPITVIVSWFHGERGDQKATGAELVAIAAVLLLAGASVAWFGIRTIEAPSAEAPKRVAGISDSIPRLAVLAFTTIGSPDDDFFAHGLTREINSRLSGLRSLAVLSRSSADMYQESGKTVRQFGVALGADYVLHGTVQWQHEEDGESRVRVTPEILRIADDTQIWSLPLDRKFVDALTMQSEIALDVITQLDLALSDNERSVVEDRPTDNALAYEAFLKGMKWLPDGHAPPEDFWQARQLLAQSVALDPGFALAWTQLAQADMKIYWWGLDANPGRLDMALESIERAEAIDPDLPEVAIVRGDHFYRLREYDQSLQAYSDIFSKRPFDARIIRNIGYMWRRQGLTEQALEQLEKGAQLDPLQAYHKLELAWTHLFLDNFDRALSLIEESRRTDPTEEWIHLIEAIVYWSRAAEGDLERADEALAAFPDPRSDYPAWFVIMQRLFEGDSEGALDRLARTEDPVFIFQNLYDPKELMRGLIYLQQGKVDMATVELQRAIEILEAAYAENPDDFRLPLSLGKAYAGLGMKGKALQAASEGVELMPLENDKLMGLDAIYHEMQIYAMVGEEDRALDAMQKLYSIPSPYKGVWFTHNPVFKDLQKRDRFWTLLEG
jgi:TolB-like protein/Tfp pilus assembly protein PilF